MNVKFKINEHLRKHKTHYPWLYLVFVVFVIAVGIINTVLQSNMQSEASEARIQYNSEKAVLDKNNQDDNKLFHRTKKEELLYKMIEKENLELSPTEENYIKNH